MSVYLLLVLHLMKTVSSIITNIYSNSYYFISKAPFTQGEQLKVLHIKNTNITTPILLLLVKIEPVAQWRISGVVLISLHDGNLLLL